MSELEKNLLELGQLCKINSSDIKINLDILTSLDSEKTGKKAYWKSGTGYGSSDSGSEWNIKDFLNKQNEINDDVEELLLKIYDICVKCKLSNELLDSKIFFDFMVSKFNGLSILEFNKEHKNYNIIADMLLLILPKKDECKIKKLLFDSLGDFVIDVSILIEEEHLDELGKIYKKYIEIFNICQNNYHNLSKNQMSQQSKADKENMKDNYNALVKLHQFKDGDILSNHLFKQKNPCTNHKTIMRIVSEINSLRKNLPVNWDSSILMRISKKNINMINFIIIGPKDTPYHNGIFEFHAYFPDEYPSGPPKVLINTTDGGRVRFNPNLYNCGKVCLSLLGTWSGQQGESWNPQISTFLQVLISIQSLILVENPYYNEPGYEKSMNTPSGKSRNFDYNDNIRLETIKVTMLKMLQSKNEYSDFIKEHFKLKRDEICKTIEGWIDESKSKKSAMIDTYEKLKEEFKKL